MSKIPVTAEQLLAHYKEDFGEGSSMYGDLVEAVKYIAARTTPAESLRAAQARIVELEAYIKKTQPMMEAYLAPGMSWNGKWVNDRAEDAEKRVAVLEKALEGAKLDSKRLNWLERVGKNYFSPLWAQDWIYIRSAIDDAMKKAAQPSREKEGA